MPPGFFRSCSPLRGRVSAAQGKEGAAGAGSEPFPPASTCTPCFPAGSRGPPQPPPKDPPSQGSYLGCSSPCSAVFVQLVGGRALQSLASFNSKAQICLFPAAHCSELMGWVSGRLGGFQAVIPLIHILHGVCFSASSSSANQPSTW